MDEITQCILDENDLVVKQIPEGGHSLMSAISNCLYFSSGNHKQIQEQCVRFLKQMIEQKKVPDQLNSFVSNITLLNDYISEPSQFDYHKVNCELVSLLFQTKVQVYFISEDNQLHSFIINNRYKRKIEMIKINNHYDPLFSRKFIQLITLSQQIVQKIIDQSLNSSRKPQEKFVNYEYENWFQDRILQLNENNVNDSEVSEISSQSLSGAVPSQRIKRSLSDNFCGNPIQWRDATAKLSPSKYTIIEENEDFSKNQQQVSIFEKDEPKPFTFKPLINLKKSTHKNPVFLDVSAAKQEDNINKDKRDIIFTPKLDVSSAQGIERRPILSPVYFVKSNPPGISPKPNLIEKSKPVFDWICEDESSENGMTEERSSETESEAQDISYEKKIKKNTTDIVSQNIIVNEDKNNLKSSELSQKKVKEPAKESKEKQRGYLKFFDEKKNFGFFVLEEDGSDIFVHFRELEKAGISKEMLKENEEKKQKLNFIFTCRQYVGKYKESRKAIDIEYLAMIADPINNEMSLKQDSQIHHEDHMPNKQTEEETQNKQKRAQPNHDNKKNFSDRFAGFSKIVANALNK